MRPRNKCRMSSWKWAEAIPLPCFALYLPGVGKVIHWTQLSKAAGVKGHRWSLDLELKAPFRSISFPSLRKATGGKPAVPLLLCTHRGQEGKGKLFQERCSGLIIEKLVRSKVNSNRWWWMKNEDLAVSEFLLFKLFKVLKVHFWC